MGRLGQNVLALFLKVISLLWLHVNAQTLTTFFKVRDMVAKILTLMADFDEILNLIMVHNWFFSSEQQFSIPVLSVDHAVWIQ